MLKKTFLLSSLVAGLMTGCNIHDLAHVPLVGTYSVTHLKQYQDGQLVFEGDLPAVLGDTMTIRHGLGLSLASKKSKTTDAFISYHMLQSWGNYSRSYGRPVAENQIRIQRTGGQFALYTNDGTLLGRGDGGLLTFEFAIPDTLGRNMRYVYEAKKTSDTPNRY